jgi:hypothetical protein
VEPGFPGPPTASGGGARYLSARHRDHPESGCAVACIAADVARAGGSARATYTHQVQEYLAVLADLIDNPDRQVGEQGSFVRIVHVPEDQLLPGQAKEYPRRPPLGCMFREAAQAGDQHVRFRYRG